MNASLPGAKITLAAKLRSIALRQPPDPLRAQGYVRFVSLVIPFQWSGPACGPRIPMPDLIAPFRDLHVDEPAVTAATRL